MSNKKLLKKQPMKLNIAQLDMVITVLIMGQHSLINKKFLYNIYQLFDKFDPRSYTEIEKNFRVNLIKKLVIKRLDEGIHEKEALLSLINVEGMYKEQTHELLHFLKDEYLSDEEILALDTMISNLLAYGFIDAEYTSIIDMLNKYKAEDYEDFTEWVEQFEDKIGGLSYKIKTRKAATIDSKNDIEFDAENMLNSISSLIKRKKNPSLKVRTGLQAMNRLLDGGWEPGRIYCALGVAKGWKSGFLLNAVLWAKKYNKKLKAKDPSKKPVILYVTQENTIPESMERVWSSLFGNESKIEDYTPETAHKMLQERSIINYDNDTRPEIIFKYRSNKSISTVDLDAMIEELYNDGKEVVFLVHDYIKRIRPASRTVKDLRLELGDVVNEMKTIAVERDIPILTAHQLNRLYTFCC